VALVTIPHIQHWVLLILNKMVLFVFYLFSIGYEFYFSGGKRELMLKYSLAGAYCFFMKYEFSRILQVN